MGGALGHGFGVSRSGAAGLPAFEGHADLAAIVRAGHGGKDEQAEKDERARDNEADLITAHALAPSVKKLPMRRNFQ